MESSLSLPLPTGMGSREITGLGPGKHPPIGLSFTASVIWPGEENWRVSHKKVRRTGAAALFRSFFLMIRAAGASGVWFLLYSRCTNGQSALPRRGCVLANPCFLASKNRGSRLPLVHSVKVKHPNDDG